MNKNIKKRVGVKKGTRVRNLDEGKIKDISVRKKEKNVFVAILITLIWEGEKFQGQESDQNKLKS